MSRGPSHSFFIIFLSIICDLYAPSLYVLLLLLTLGNGSKRLEQPKLALCPMKPHTFRAAGISSSSIFHIRQHSRFWAKVRKIIKELNLLAFWRATFDNLDFRIQFAKKLCTGGHFKFFITCLLVTTHKNVFRKAIRMYVFRKAIFPYSKYFLNSNR